MKKIVKVPYPLNVSDEHRRMYLPRLTYTKPNVKVKYLKNVFVTSTGYCLNNKGLVKECHHNYSLQIHDYKNEAAKCYFNCVDNPENLIVLNDDKIYLLIHHPWFNYYHWICETIFRLWMVRKKLDSLILILPEHYMNADFIIGSLEPFKIRNFFFIPAGKHLLVKNLCLPQIKPQCDSYNRFQVQQIRRFYNRHSMLVVKAPTKRIERLYVSRSLANRRRIINENEILPIVKRHDFEIFYPEKHSFIEQVAVFSNIRYLIGTHGSGLTNMLFMSSGTSLLELHKDKTNELNYPSPLFWYLAEALNIKYYHQLCDTHGREDYFYGDYIVDARLFEINLMKMLAC